MSHIAESGSWARLGDLVVEMMDAKGVPGVAVGILHEGEMASAGFGVTHVEHPLPVTDTTLCQIGSITKTFTGTAIMRLVEDGQVDLDAPVRQYLPDFRVVDEAASAQVTVRQLLTHMGGWEGDFFHDTGPGDDALARYVADMGNQEQLAPVGSVWSYNNSGFCVAGRIIEVVLSQGYEAAVRQLVFEPLGLRSATYEPSEVMTRRFVVGHHASDGGFKVARPWALPRSVRPAGGIACDVQDLLRYARFHMGDGGTEDGARMLSLESVAQMQMPQVSVRGADAWGLSWRVDDANGTRLVSHGGGTDGQITLLQLVPEHGFALAVLTNADAGGAVTHELSRWVLREYLGLDILDPVLSEASVDDLAAYAGRYVRPFADVELGILGGRLIGQLIVKGGFPTEDSPAPPLTPPFALGLCETDRLVGLDGTMKNAIADIVRSPDGSIGWLRMNSRIHVREA